ncbi:MAG: phosphoglucosamine mutase [Dehalococcoidales bacterium]|nr:phosphoglucosamine mutase [Dehalococcoidales bacterium]
MQLFGTSGVRRIFDSDLLQLALKIGLAVGKVYSNVVVGSDTRTSGQAMKHAVISGLLAAGSRCQDAGVLPTPTLALAGKDFNAAVMVTASHNPPEYNGIKLLNPDGSAFAASQQKQIEAMVSGDSFPAAPWTEIKSGGTYGGAVNRHIEHIRRQVPSGLRLKIAVDCGCGAASVITPYLLAGLGCEVIALNCYPSGLFPHPVEPVEANLGDLMAIVRSSGADLGIAHDGDADRMMAVDDKGRFVSGDKLLALFARETGAKSVVTTIDASMMIDEMGFDVIRTRVGDNYVSEALKQSGDFGGEPSGSWIFPDNSLCPDGIYAAARLVTIASQQRLSSLLDTMPAYPLLRGSVSSKGIARSQLDDRLMTLRPVSVSNVDGTRLAFEDGWLLVRASGTEPKIRITAEARTEARVRQIYNDGIRAVQNNVSEAR